jgi:hypothetical protein
MRVGTGDIDIFGIIIGTAIAITGGEAHERGGDPAPPLFYASGKKPRSTSSLPRLA